MAFLGEDGMLGDVSEEAVASVGKGASGPLPAGWYRCALVEDEAQPKPWGVGLSMQFQILDGEHENRRIFDYLCVRHTTSQQAEEIARAKLKAFAIAAGSKAPDNMRDTAPYYGKPVMVEVYRSRDDEKYADEDGKKARIGSFKSVAEYRAEHGSAPVPNNSPAPEPSAWDSNEEPPF